MFFSNRATKKTAPEQMNTRVFALTPRLHAWLLSCQILNLATLALQLHWLYLVFAISAIIYQGLRIKRVGQQQAGIDKSGRVIALPHAVVVLCAIGGSITLALAGRELGLLLAMVHLLCLAYTLKSFELSSRKDLYQMVILGVFIAISALIFEQSIYYSLAVLVIVFANFIILSGYFAPNHSVKKQLKLLTRLVALSIPLTIVLFIAFPKLSPFWQVPNVKSAKTGMSDTVKIGDIAKLALSDELAFRVSFTKQVPSHNQRYWRTLVLDEFDGTTWRQAKSKRQREHFALRRGQAIPINATLAGAGLRYQVIAEPSFQSWLFALDLAVTGDARISQRSDYSILYRGILSKTLSYELESFPEAVLGLELSDYERTLNLSIVGKTNPKLYQKGRELNAKYPNKGALINQVLADFNQQNFHYTLEPPRIENNSLDQFYFTTQAGFCEHYASSFTYLMRAAGIPARMVVGYLGGELNPNANYYAVYQRDAHAWAEVWLQGIGWQRVDPTGAVNPERVERGFSGDLLQEYAQLSSNVFGLGQMRSMAWLNQIKQQISALDYQWTRWVIGYTGKKQLNVMRTLQNIFSKITSLLWLVGLVLFSFTLFIFLRMIKTPKVAQKPWQQLYQQALLSLAAQQLVKPTSMSARQFSTFIACRYPMLSASFSELSHCFSQLEYQQVDPSGQTQAQILQQMKLSYRRLRRELWRRKLRRLLKA